METEKQMCMVFVTAFFMFDAINNDEDNLLLLVGFRCVVRSNMVSMASLALVAFFYLVSCMHSSNARLLSAIFKPFPANPHHVSISLQVAEKNGGHEMVERSGAQPPAAATTPFLKAEFGEFLTQESKKIKNGGVVKEGSDIVESSSSHHVALLKGTHVKDSKRPITSEYHGKEEVTRLKNDDIVVTDYQPPHRKTPIHNK
ncbi:hypothetical protein L6452_12455 [Arctium lappa]|uniref:Uncharacterized protein n=1 Tax=Arctium lappa TaxID=4217 RepID=A0ACB9DRD7_ARCLA|nr:hypothetical protein L6452_12455 [Arctium lappa]